MGLIREVGCNNSFIKDVKQIIGCHLEYASMFQGNMENHNSATHTHVICFIFSEEDRTVDITKI